MYSNWYEYLYSYWWYHQKLQRDLEAGICFIDSMDIDSMDIDLKPVESTEILQQIKHEVCLNAHKLNIIGNSLGIF